MASVTKTEEAKAADLIAWRLKRLYYVEQFEWYARDLRGTVAEEPTHRVGVVRGEEPYTSIDVLEVRVTGGGVGKHVRLRLRHAGVDVNIGVTVTGHNDWQPLLGTIDPRTGGINAVTTALEAIRPIVKAIGGGKQPAFPQD